MSIKQQHETRGAKLAGGAGAERATAGAPRPSAQSPRARRPLRRALPLLGFLLLALYGCGAAGPPRAGERLPDAGVPALAGEPIALAGEPGQAVWVSFWASWCAPCREEWPGINAAARELGPAVRIIAVAVNEAPETVAAFVAEHPADFAVGLDPEGELAAQFGVAGVPTHVLVGPDGTIRQIVRGPLDGPRAAALLGLPMAPAAAP
ncbi:MAG TPA: TlpA disulfide reductase family protein [Chloroflexaceae bacterium]|nr:TlpA disulfide reductase family protein [Chloroflexaceae bacterium]